MITTIVFYGTTLLVSNNSITFAVSRVITLEHNNEELRNTNGCYLVTQFSSNPTNLFILSELSFLAKFTKRFLCDQIFAVEIFITHCNQNYCCLSLNHQNFLTRDCPSVQKRSCTACSRSRTARA